MASGSKFVFAIPLSKLDSLAPWECGQNDLARGRKKWKKKKKTSSPHHNTCEAFVGHTHGSSANL